MGCTDPSKGVWRIQSGVLELAKNEVDGVSLSRTAKVLSTRIRKPQSACRHFSAILALKVVLYSVPDGMMGQRASESAYVCVYERECAKKQTLKATIVAFKVGSHKHSYQAWQSTHCAGLYVE